VLVRPSVIVRLGVDETFGSGEGKMKSVARRESELDLTAFVHNFEFCY
jgi:hypothetical protein